MAKEMISPVAVVVQSAVEKSFPEQREKDMQQFRVCVLLETN